MLAEPSSIYFMTQLRFFPIEQLRFGKSFVRDLYSELAKPGGHSYENLTLQSNPPRMSTDRATPRGDSASVCQVGADTILIEETEAEINVDGFVEIVGTVLGAVRKIKTEIPPVFAQKCVFRCLAKPKSNNSISLLAGKVSNVLKAIQPFERPPMFFGVRFRFPPFKMVAESGDHGNSEVEENHDFMSVRFETWSKDVKLVWMEASAMYFFSDAIEVGDLARIGGNIKEAHQFLSEKCINFLNQFDDLPDPKVDDNDENEGEE